MSLPEPDTAESKTDFNVVTTEVSRCLRQDKAPAAAQFELKPGVEFITLMKTNFNGNDKPTATFQLIGSSIDTTKKVEAGTGLKIRGKSKAADNKKVELFTNTGKNQSLPKQQSLCINKFASFERCAANGEFIPQLMSVGVSAIDSVNKGILITDMCSSVIYAVDKSPFIIQRMQRVVDGLSEISTCRKHEDNDKNKIAHGRYDARNT